MQKIFTLILLVLIPVALLTAQNEIPCIENQALKLTSTDSMKASMLPELKLPKLYTANFFDTLPAVLDNSDLLYWRPVFNQVQLECGQASGIGQGFTYEINYERNANGSLPANQYPTHFAWNFTNSGYNHGVSFFDSWEVIRGFGTPDVTTYGGMYIPAGMARIWVDGYAYYYNAMKNRIEGVYSIYLGSEEGIVTLKHWLNDHLEGADDGGVANFYANVPSTVSLAAGTPEAGKPCVVQWANYSNHAMTIVGYNDSIRYDYNGDGQYTNNIDINADGVVNLKDWEVGAFRFANNYAGGPSWGDNGFAWMMYRVLAFPNEQGGIWNQTGYVLKTRKAVDPILTMKVQLKHNCRSKIKVTAGISSDTSLTYPQYTKEFSAFNYQGGDYYMQGGTLEDHKTLEFGLDVSDLLNYHQSGSPARFFLLINEDDPTNLGTGQLLSFSMIDYSNGGTETNSGYASTALTENGLSTFSMTASPVFTFPEITGDSLPLATVGQVYSEQLQATGGVSPYFFQFDKDFAEQYSAQTYPAINQQAIVTNNNDDGTAVVSLGFTFPFGGKEYSEIIIHTDGYIFFEEDQLSWPYLVSSELFNRYIGKIAPFYADFKYTLAQGHGIWYEGNSNYAQFRWKAYFNNFTATDTADFGLKLFPTGKVEFFYGTLNIPAGAPWESFINQGNPNQIQYPGLNDSTSITPGCHYSFEPTIVPEGLLCTSNGLIKGTPEGLQAPVPVRIKVIDAANLVSKKELIYSTHGVNSLLIENIQVFSNGDDLIEAGELTQLSFDVHNITNENFSDVHLAINCLVPQIQFSDSTEWLGTIAAHDTVHLTFPIAFQLLAHIGNNVEVEFESLIFSATDTFVGNFDLPVFAPEIKIKKVKVGGANGYLEPGVSANLRVYIENMGDAKATNLGLTFSSSDPYFMIMTPLASFTLLNPGQVDSVTFPVYVSSLASVVTNLQVAFLADYAYLSNDVEFLPLQFLGDDFESGSLQPFGWLNAGDAYWMADDTVVYEGDYAARSGFITHLEESDLIYEIDVADQGELGFYKKVSSEPTYDFLRFYVDGNLIDEWAGNHDWSHEAYILNPGPHILRWSYQKDYSVNTALDAAWIDYVTLPVIQSLFVSVDEIALTQKTGLYAYPNPFNTNCVIGLKGKGIEPVEIKVFDARGCLIETFKSNSGQTIHWNAKGLRPGIYFVQSISGKAIETIRVVKMQ